MNSRNERTVYQRYILPVLLLVSTLLILGAVLWIGTAFSKKEETSPKPTLTLTPTPTVSPSPSVTAVPDTPTPTDEVTETEKTASEGQIVNLRDGCLYTYSDMAADMAALAERYPAVFSYRSVGKSADGREILAATLGNPGAGRQVILTAGMHAREYVNCYCVMRQIETYLTDYESAAYEGVSYADLFNAVCLVILPMTNPDGIDMAEEGISALRSEELRRTVTEIWQDTDSRLTLDEYLHKYWKSNARGVDINRNFNALWNAFPDGVGAPSNKNYKGEAPASEPETQALVALTESLSNPVASVCIHMQGEVLYWRCFQTGALETANRTLVELTRELTGYTVIEEEQVEPSYSNWTILAHGIPTITVENAVSAYPLSFDLADGILEKNEPLWAAYAYEYRPWK